MVGLCRGVAALLETVEEVVLVMVVIVVVVVVLVAPVVEVAFCNSSGGFVRLTSLIISVGGATKGAVGCGSGGSKGGGNANEIGSTGVGFNRGRPYLWLDAAPYLWGPEAAFALGCGMASTSGMGVSWLMSVDICDESRRTQR